MARSNHRKRAALFLAAVLLPSAVLVGTTVRLIGQERELGARRSQEESVSLALEVGQWLSDDLDGLLHRVASGDADAQGLVALADSMPSVVAVAVEQGERLVFAWDVAADPKPGLDGATRVRYRRLSAEGTEAEHRRQAFGEAARLYGRASDVVEVQGAEAILLRGEARVNRARALSRAGRTEEAREAYRQLLDLPSLQVDADGMPFMVYGLEGLRRLAVDPGELWDPVDAALEPPIHVSLPALLAIRDLVLQPGDSSGASAPPPAIADRLERAEAVLRALEQLREDHAGLSVAARRRPAGANAAVWQPYGDAPWLVGRIETGTEGTILVPVVDPAVRLGRLAGSTTASTGDPEVGAAARALTLLPPGADSGIALGPELGGLRASYPPGYPPPPEPGEVEWWFIRLLLPVILLLTAFTAYLAWRDVRRETEAVRLRTLFVSNVTHELKTPLTSIRMFAETLRMGRHTGPEAQKRYLDTVVQETERLSRLINNVLDFARIDRGEKSYHMAPADPGAVARQAADALAAPLARDGYALTVEIDEDLPALEADADALTQAVLNLLSNAAKFSRPGSDIALRVFADGAEVGLQVADHGRGIATADREAIFRNFYRAPEVERDGIPGTGLGLALVAHVAEAHGGRVEVVSEPGQGSTFTIRIPWRGNASVETGEAAS